ncbi:glycosyl hydrolase 115 family protein [Reichenbachiella ulvae]|uniref:Glycosyl hydrolase 115 family protein n=1 Tax=Reichenbachiella ulvae TaxID=2980104 RepID=A0ABT3CYZ6_9BACT|nr:glycosyl hydrolase 115 family protein [Reichenbachiella ulvae]MCV9388917.1 glycosyl hydrolase 115 family protein [Reichenbachiella ulvae]
MRYIPILLLVLVSCSQTHKDDFIIDPATFAIYVDAKSDPLIHWAVKDFASDIESITGEKVNIITDDLPGPDTPGIVIGSLGDPLIQTNSKDILNDLSQQWEKFIILKQGKQLLITGSDVRGTVYGLFEVSERLGISPWKWWADVKTIKKEQLTLHLPNSKIEQSPSVQFRGIFLNDEDWGLQPWAAKTLEPETGDIGPKTYEKIFQLLLRLKANTLWPAMHPSTKAFFSIPGNQEMAEKYHIHIGTSHAEPMLRNNVDEWKEEYGEYNYFTNREKVQAYWQERVAESQSGDYIYTVGMRGIHDSGMEGHASPEEKRELLETIISDQRQMLSNELDVELNKIPQVFIPYKEVLDIYNQGMDLPDDISLMWTDDNYGYIRRHSDEQEQKRAGGSGVYYHLSYWGRPHDYLWLSTTQPGLIAYEMTRAYQNGAQKIWIANVGDIKPAEYNMELFMDLAWDISQPYGSPDQHLQQYCEREFGPAKAQEIANLLEEYYHLAFIRKPEYMGWSQTEPTTETHPATFTQANNNELQRRIDAYTKLYETAEDLKKFIPEERRDAYFQLVEYPVKGAALMNFKFLRAKQAMLSADSSQRSDLSQMAQQAYDEIVQLTQEYNHEISEGKWQHMMSMSPRNLPVFSMPDFHLTDTLPSETTQPIESDVIAIQASEYTQAQAANGYEWKAQQGLGYSQSAVTLHPFSEAHFSKEMPYLEYEFMVEKAGSYQVEIRCLPTHSNDYNYKLRVAIDEDKPVEYPINTKGRSAQWKKNVLRNSTRTVHTVELSKKGKHNLRIEVNQSGIVLDQIAIVPEGYPDFYEIESK